MNFPRLVGFILSHMFYICSIRFVQAKPDQIGDDPMHINRLVERFLREQQLPPTKFGRLAARDPRLVLDMRMGREIRPEMEQLLRQFMQRYPQMQTNEERKAG
jgi:hypothetical protein